MKNKDRNNKLKRKKNIIINGGKVDQNKQDNELLLNFYRQNKRKQK